jgi:hypothetical protein
MAASNELIVLRQRSVPAGTVPSRGGFGCQSARRRGWNARASKARCWAGHELRSMRRCGRDVLETFIDRGQLRKLVDGRAHHPDQQKADPRHEARSPSATRGNACSGPLCQHRPHSRRYRLANKGYSSPQGEVYIAGFRCEHPRLHPNSQNPAPAPAAVRSHAAAQLFDPLSAPASLPAHARFGEKRRALEPRRACRGRW